MMLKILAWATLSAIRRDLWLLAAVFWFLRWVVGAHDVVDDARPRM